MLFDAILNNKTQVNCIVGDTWDPVNIMASVSHLQSIMTLRALLVILWLN